MTDYTNERARTKTSGSRVAARESRPVLVLFRLYLPIESAYLTHCRRRSEKKKYNFASSCSGLFARSVSIAGLGECLTSPANTPFKCQKQEPPPKNGSKNSKAAGGAVRQRATFTLTSFFLAWN